MTGIIDRLLATPPAYLVGGAFAIAVLGAILWLAWDVRATVRRMERRDVDDRERAQRVGAKARAAIAAAQGLNGVAARAASDADERLDRVTWLPPKGKA